MRERPSARLLLISPENRVLLFRFTHTTGPLQGQEYWATPGGALESGETFEQAAARELAEEVGVKVPSVGPVVDQRRFEMQLPSGEFVIADERFFLIRVADERLSASGWTEHEREVMTGHRWWSSEALESTSEIVFPEQLLSMLRSHTI